MQYIIAYKHHLFANFVILKNDVLFISYFYRVHIFELVMSLFIFATYSNCNIGDTCVYKNVWIVYS